MADNRELQIEAKIDQEKATSLVVSTMAGGVAIENMSQVFEMAKLMALSGPAVPSYLRGQPGACLAIVLQATEWRMSSFAVANKSYKVTNKGEDRIAYESQLIHGVIEARAPLVGRLRCSYEGEGDERRCIVTGKLRGEDAPFVFRSEPLGKLRPARNEYGNIKGSPLWDRKPDLQMWYDASRDWARQYCPDVLMGVYTADELESAGFVGPDNAKEINPPAHLEEQLHHRLSAKAVVGAGFDASAIATTIGEVAKRDAPTPSVSESPQSASTSETERAASGEGVPAPDPGAAVNVASTEARIETEASSAPVSQEPAQSAAPAEPAGGGPTAPPAGQAEPGSAAENERIAAEHGVSLDKLPAVPEATTASPASAGPSPAEGPKPPVIPKDSADFPRWVDENLPEFETAAEVDVWWKSDFERKLRNSLPNLTQEIMDEAKAKVVARKKQLRKEV
jgi:hypothetical protein